METVQLGVPRCRVQVSVPLHSDHPEWADLRMDVVSVQLLETLEVAALGVLNSFCAQHIDEVSTSLVGLLPAVDPEDPAWRHRMGHMADLLAGMRPLDVLQEMVRREGAMYRLQALRSVASTAVTPSALDSAGELGVRTHHLRSLSFGYMGLERDLCRCLNHSTSMGGTRSKVEGGDHHDLEPEGLREDTRHEIYTGSGS
jgi:hypothetical protein